MKKIVALLTVAGMTALALPVPAAEEKAPSEKDLCLLYSQNCANRAYSLQEKIRKLQDEIAKGPKVYTPEEIKRLEDKLKEAEDMLDFLMYSPSRGGGRK